MRGEIATSPPTRGLPSPSSSLPSTARPRPSLRKNRLRVLAKPPSTCPPANPRIEQDRLHERPRRPFVLPRLGPHLCFFPSQRRIPRQEVGRLALVKRSG